MKFTVLLPHYKTGKMTAYAVSQLLKHKGNHDLQIIVIDNSTGDTSIAHILETSLRHHCTVLHYPPGVMQSHGIAFDFALKSNRVESEYFITIESDSFPTRDGWLDNYEMMASQGVDAAGSLLRLSGGLYLHPAGAMYRRSVWAKAEAFCRAIPYTYFPNMGMKSGFPCHLMVHNRVLAEFCANPERWGVTLHHTYSDPGLSSINEEMLVMSRMKKAKDYEPVCHPFHNGMGRSQEDFNTYRFRTIDTEKDRVILDEKDDVIYRMGAEPGQWFSWWMMAMGFKIVFIPTEMKWLPNREEQQQEYTMMANGFKHLWAVTAYNGNQDPGLQDIVTVKRDTMDSLYDSLPKDQRL